MRTFIVSTCLLFVCIGFSQHYDTVVIENENIDRDNIIYKPGNVFIFDYEIVLKGETKKLQFNKGRFTHSKFKIAPIASDSIEVDKIHLLVRPVADSERTNENQTQITYLQEPQFASIPSTGVVENENNIWIHPIRLGFFGALETAPFPYVQYPINIGDQWEDAMKIGQPWSNELWGQWEGRLHLKYEYRVDKKTTIETPLGDLECYIIESTANSTIGETKLKSYFSTKYGFVKLEYDLINNLEINMWLIDFKTEQEFVEGHEIVKTKKYIKD